MYVDAIAVALILLYGVLGYRYGLTGALINLAGMLGGYIAAALYARDAAMLLAERTGMAPLAALPVASLLIFLLVTRSFYLLHLLVKKRLEGDKQGPSTLLTVDRMGGLAFGLAKGAAIVTLVLWALPSLLGSAGFASQMGLAESHLVQGVRGLIETASRFGFSLLTDDPNAQAVLARAVSEPRAVMQESSNLIQNARLKACMADPFVQQQVRSQGLLGVVNSSQFDSVLSDPGFQKSLQTLGFQPQNGRAVSRDEVARALAPVNAKLQAQMASMQSAAGSGEMQAFMSDPSVQERLQRGEVNSVLNDPRLVRALGMVTGKTDEAAAGGAPARRAAAAFGAASGAAGSAGSGAGGGAGTPAADPFGQFGVSSRGAQDTAPQPPVQASGF